MQWTLAYIALAYSLLHGLELVGHGFDWPHVIYRVAAVLLILGAPAAGIVAWYHGHRAQHRASGTELSILTVLLVIAGTVLWIAALSDPEHHATDVAASPSPASHASVPTESAASAPRTSIAVIPFANLTGDPEKEYFSDGMAEELINALARVPGLHVPARTSSFAYKGRNTDVRQIARDLGVAAVLEGSVRSADERIRVTAQLIDARSGFHLWSQSYDREFSDLFKLQDELSAAIVQVINVKMNGSLGSAAALQSPTHDLAAYEAYLQAVALTERPHPDSNRLAIELYQRAIDLDPKFARAMTGKALALVMSVLGGLTKGPAVRETVTEAARAGERAIALDPELSSAHVVLGIISALRGNHIEAEKRFGKAFALYRDDPNALRFYSLFVKASTGHLAEATEVAHTAFRLAPASSVSLAMNAAAHSGVGRDEEALAYIDMAHKLGMALRGTPFSMIRANAAARAGRYTEAAHHIAESATGEALAAGARETVELVYSAMADPRKKRAALAALERLESRAGAQAFGSTSGPLIAAWYSQLGDLDRAFDTARRGYLEARQAGIIGMDWQWYWLPELRAFRRDARFDRLMTEVGAEASNAREAYCEADVRH